MKTMIFRRQASIGRLFQFPGSKRPCYSEMAADRHPRPARSRKSPQGHTGRHLSPLPPLRVKEDLSLVYHPLTNDALRFAYAARIW